MISDVVLVASITAVGGAIPASVAAVMIYLTRNRVDLAVTKVDEVGHRVDGRMDQLLKLAEEGSFARGVKQETDKVAGQG